MSRCSPRPFRGFGPVNFKNVEAAIAAFEATLITPNAPFDRYLRATTRR